MQRAVKNVEKSVLSCRSRKVAAKARVSQLQELASAGNPEGPAVGTSPSISRRWDDNSCTELDALVDFASRASEETNKFEPTSRLRGDMDEFRRLKVKYPNAPLENLPNLRFLQRRWQGIGKIQEMGAAAREAAETIAKTVMTTSGGEGTALARTPASAAPVTDLLRDPGGKRRVIVPAPALAPITLAEKTDVAVTDVKDKTKTK